MWTKTILTRNPKGTFSFVGRVPQQLLNEVFNTVEEAKIAAFDVMMEIGPFPVDVQAIDGQPERRAKALSIDFDTYEQYARARSIDGLQAIPRPLWEVIKKRRTPAARSFSGPART